MNAGIISAQTSVQPAAKKAEEAIDESLPPLEKVRIRAGRCEACRLAAKRTNMVFGEGNPDADIMFIGEGPGEDEDLSGRPFVGKAGQLLTKIIENGMKIPRSQVYIANIVKCRPPANRDPMPDEAQCCIGFLKEQIKIVNPKVLILLGKVAMKNLLGIDGSMTKAREATYEYEGIKVFVTYHPSALLRNESFKRPVWEDIKKAMKYLGMM
ncbi:uracil-DNA glycosylase [bacterium]|nr:uracil-DNA glycosylase [bacterium]MBP5591146.1 uracil-DNA glycosylase [bacterium]